MKNIFKNKKIQYGSLSVILTAVILALLVLINATFTLFADKYHLYMDMTDQQLFTLSKTSKELLHGLNFSGKVSIIFLQEKDKIEDSSYENTGDIYLKQVHELMLDYKAEFSDMLELKYVDMYSNPGALADYKFSMTPTDVIFDNNNGITKIINYKSFFVVDSTASSSSFSPVGFYGEHKITSTLLSLCTEKVTAYLTTGHGESALGDAFNTVLESCGYAVETVNLSELSVDKLLEDRPKLVIMLNPKTDLLGVSAGSKNEVAWLSSILDGSYDKVSGNPTPGSLLVFAEPGNELPVLNTCLLTWGMTLNTGSADLVNESEEHSFGTESYMIMPQYQSDPNSLTYSLVAKLRNYRNFSVAMNGTGTVSVNSDPSYSGSIYADSILHLSQDARNGSESTPAAGMSVMAIAQKKTVINNIDKYNYVFACADSSVVSDEYLTTSSYANEALITNILRATINETDAHPDSVLIEYKDYTQEKNVSGISTFGLKAFLVFMAVIIPLAILAVGIVVNVRRKNK